MEGTSELSGPGHYNKVALLLRWPLSEVLLYLPLDYSKLWLLRLRYSHGQSFKILNAYRYFLRSP